MAQFVVGRTCPSDADLDEIRAAVVAALSDLIDDDRTAAVCGLKQSAGTNVVTVGGWIDPEDLTVEQLRAGLAETDLLAPGRTATLLLGADLIRLVMLAEIPPLPMRSGRATITDIDTTFDAGRITTKARGSFDLPFPLTKIRFTYTIREELSISPAGSVPPLRAQSRTNVDTRFGGRLINSFLIALLSPLLGTIAFFAADPLAEAAAPDIRGPGGAIAAQWPHVVLTRIQPPALPGKVTLAWEDVTVDQRGVQTSGSFALVGRNPDVTVAGPDHVTIREELAAATVRFAAAMRDLRAPSISWAVTGTGRAFGGPPGPELRVLFRPPGGTANVAVNVSDADGLTATDSRNIAVSVRPRPQGTSPL